MIRKFFQRIGMALFAVALVLPVIGTMVAHAAADADLTSTLASSTALATDNKLTLLAYFVAIGAIVLILRLAKGGIIMAIKWITKAFSGGGKRR